MLIKQTFANIQNQNKKLKVPRLKINKISETPTYNHFKK